MRLGAGSLASMKGLMSIIGLTKVIAGVDAGDWAGAAGVSAVAESETLVSPASLSSPNDPVKPPALGDSKEIVTVIVSPGLIFEPVAGTPVAANGAVGACSPLTSSVVPPVFLNDTSPVRWPPTDVEPRFSDV